MDNSAPTNSILDTLRTVEFRLGLKGYNVDEVDEYLEKAAVEAEQFQDRLRTANERLRQATERIAQLEADPRRPVSERAPSQPPGAAASPGPAPSPGVSEDALQRTLLLAQKFVEQTKRESEAEAAQVVSRAEDRARTLLAQAEDRARQITKEAEETLRDEVTRLEETRARLRSDVDSMNRHLEEQRAKIRASLAEALRWVDERLQSPDAVSEPPGSSDDAGTVGDSLTPSTTSGAPAAGGAPRPQAPSGAPGPADRPSQVSTPPHSVPERTQTPVGARLGVLNGGLFERGREQANALDESHLGD
jgi:DivIVA domain-containing protein